MKQQRRLARFGPFCLTVSLKPRARTTLSRSPSSVVKPGWAIPCSAAAQPSRAGSRAPHAAKEGRKALEKTPRLLLITKG